MRRKGLLVVGLALTMACALAGTAQATVTIGSNLNGTPADNMPGCNSVPCTATNLSLPASSLAPGGLVSPVNGTVTSWKARTNNGTNLGLQVIRQVSGTTYTALNTSSLMNYSPGGGPSPDFVTSQDLKIGDAIAITTPNPQFVYATTVGATAAAWYLLPGGPLTNGQTRAADQTQGNREALIQATIEPSSKLQFISTTLNKKKGTATLTMRVPNPGSLIYPTTGQSASGPPFVTAPGDFPVTVKATGKSLKKLKKKGKVGLTTSITFTPTSGTATVSTTKVTLHKKKKKK